MTDHDEELLAAVAEPSRRRLLDVLLAKGEATPTALAAELPFTRQAVAKHLAVLQRSGLVTARRDGREVRYTVHPGRLDEAARAMADVASRWDARLQRIKALAESAHHEAQREPQRPVPQEQSH
ncbi:MAG: ArsR/SmtB family transcription factor [Spirillospora sp.]